MEVMAIGNKLLLILILGICFINPIYSQNISCNNCEDDTLFNELDLIVALKDYVTCENISKGIIQIDIYQNNNVSDIRIKANKDILTLVYKKPNCFFIADENIVYIYLDNYSEIKDSLWLNNVLKETINFLNYPQISISWAKDSVLSVSGSFILEGTFNPPIIQYRISKGDILSKEYYTEMFYPNLSEPKGIKLLKYY